MNTEEYRLNLLQKRLSAIKNIRDKMMFQEQNFTKEANDHNEYSKELDNEHKNKTAEDMENLYRKQIEKLNNEEEDLNNEIEQLIKLTKGSGVGGKSRRRRRRHTQRSYTKISKKRKYKKHRRY